MEWFTEVWYNIKALIAFWVAVVILLIPLVLFIKWQLKNLLRTVSREIGIGAVYAAQSVVMGVKDAAVDVAKNAGTAVIDAAADGVDVVKDAASGVAETAGEGVDAVTAAVSGTVASTVSGAANVASEGADVVKSAASGVVEVAGDGAGAVESLALKAGRGVKNIFSAKPAKSKKTAKPEPDSEN